MDRNSELEKIVAEVGKELIWRPLYDFEQKQLAGGVGNDADGIDPEFKDLDFKGKSVCDLGCNMGHFSFYASERGASEVVGYDLDPRVVAGARKLAGLYSVDNVEFKVCNFIKDLPERTFDMGMLIDIIGKAGIRKGKLDLILRGLELRSESEMLLTFRPVYYVNKHLNLSVDQFMAMYPNAIIKDGFFMLLDYMVEFFAENWKMAYASQHRGNNEWCKNTIYFQRR
jgi:ribosomal protein L11 methyltransferase